MRISLEDVRAGVRLLADLPGFLRAPFTIEDARETLRRRFAGREARFFDLAAGIFDRPHDPYRALLDHAGCTIGDLRELVGREGVDGALAALAERGVFLRCEEFKGRRPVRRGSLEIHLEPADLVRHGAVVHGVSESSGSRGPRTAVPLDLAFIRDHAIDTWLGLAAHDGLGWAHAHWGVPGGTSITNPLEFAMGGSAPARWFTPVEPDHPDLAPRYGLAARTLRLGGRLAGIRFPQPTHAPLDDPTPVVRWLRSTLDEGRIPHVWTFASSAVLACRAARKAGIDVTGARFTMGGEPTTASRRAAVEEAGAVALPRYGATETDILAFACHAPGVPDDMHFLDDRHALVATPEASRTSLPIGSLLFTSLLPSAPILLFNLSLGDVAELERAPCGCPMEALGWTLRIRGVRSFEKLTAGGIAFLDVDVVRVLEEVLPARFGGAPTDYQVVEEADASGRPCVHLRVHPDLGPLDDDIVADAFLAALGGGDGGERLMELLWREGKVVRVERVAPVRTASGKILHVHVT
ncbi:MAG TPA: hypothetical protein VEY33_11105 [Gemmatimonadota bacterium]|nr:hypothetical protein [Gemmatimonadota bacterium]